MMRAREPGHPLEDEMRSRFVCLLVSLMVLVLSAGAGHAQGKADPHAGHAMGVVDFPVTRSEEAQKEFTRAITFLHHMTYPQASTLSVQAGGGASVTSGTGTVSSHMSDTDAHHYIVNLTGVNNAQMITVTLSNVRDSSGNSRSAVPIPMGVLLGDTTGNGSVNSSDISQAKSQSGQAVTGANFRQDVTVNGSINSSDISLVKSQSGTGLP